MTRDITFRTKQNDVGHANVKIDYKSIRVTVPESFTVDEKNELHDIALILDEAIPPVAIVLGAVVPLEADYIHVRHDNKVKYIVDVRPYEED
jgi:hypothetical protein